jgi:hypothetical protein
MGDDDNLIEYESSDTGTDAKTDPDYTYRIDGITMPIKSIYMADAYLLMVGYDPYPSTSHHAVATELSWDVKGIHTSEDRAIAALMNISNVKAVQIVKVSLPKYAINNPSSYFPQEKKDGL